MPVNDKDIALIEKAIEGTLSPEEQRAFDTRLMDQSFVEEVSFQRKLIAGLESQSKYENRTRMLSDFRRVQQLKAIKKRNFVRMGLAASITLFLLASAIIFLVKEKTPINRTFTTYFTPFDGLSKPRNESVKWPEGYQSYYDGNYEKALEQLLIGVASDDQFPQESILMIGNCYLVLDQPEFAIDWLLRVGSDDSPVIGHWYLALAYLKNEELEKCEKSLKAIVETNSIYSERAQALLNESIFK